MKKAQSLFLTFILSFETFEKFEGHQVSPKFHSNQNSFHRFFSPWLVCRNQVNSSICNTQTLCAEPGNPAHRTVGYKQEVQHLGFFSHQWFAPVTQSKHCLTTLQYKAIFRPHFCATKRNMLEFIDLVLHKGHAVNEAEYYTFLILI